ncbi:unnamed protein product, partial [Scytosiphon promiscuus]
MDVDRAEEVVLTDSQKVWREVKDCLGSGDFDKAIQLCNTVRSKSPDDINAIRVKSLCLIHQDKYDKALQSASGKHKAALSPERAYCLFRLGRLEEALEASRGGVSNASSGGVDGAKRASALRHLEAQASKEDSALAKCGKWALYRLGRHEEAAEVYASITDSEDEGSFSPVSVNLAAAYAAARCGEKALEAFPVEDAMEEEGAPWELLYNLGTALVQRGALGDDAMAESCLQQAEEACRESLTAIGHSEEEAIDEAAMVRSQLAYAEARAGKVAAAAEQLKQIVRSRPSDPAVSLVSTANLAALGGYKDQQEALKRLKAAMSEKSEKGLLKKQLEACRFNKCLLLLQCGKTEECRDELEAVRSAYPDSDLGPRIEAALLSKRGKGEEAAEVLNSHLSKAKPGSEEEMSLKLCVAQQLHASAGDLALAAETLEGVGGTVTGTPAAASALAGLYSAMGETEKAKAAVLGAAEAARRGEHGLAGEDQAKALISMADWLQAEGFYPEAADTYSKVLDLGAELDGDMRVQAQASLVIAYSYFDSVKSEEAASKLPFNADLGSTDGLDPLALEMTELPRSSKARKLVLVDKASQKAERRQNKRDPEAILRKRAKKRAKYIAKLVEEGKIDPTKPIPKPDPERWIPRSHRAYGKRGRKRNKFVGAQGSGDGAAKDTAKLDALARAQAKKATGEKVCAV